MIFEKQFTHLKRWIFRNEHQWIERAQQELNSRTKQLNTSISQTDKEKERFRRVNNAYEKIVNVSDLQKQLDICQSKKVYETEAEAEYAALALYYWDSRMVRPYRCDVCFKYHLTHAKKPSHLVRKELVMARTRNLSALPISDCLDEKTITALKAMME